jgi:hypothetical protein
MAKSDEAIEAANRRAQNANNRAAAAAAELDATKTKTRQRSKEEMADRNHIMVRVVSETTGILGLYGGAFVGQRFVGSNRRIVKAVPITWNALGGLGGVVLKLGSVAMEDTWWEPFLAVPGEFGKGMFAGDLGAKGAEMRAKAEAAKKDGKK